MEKLRRNKKIILLFILPALLIYSIALPLPIISSVIYGFFKWDIVQPMKFVGIGNYIKMFTNDTIFYTAVTNTFVFTIGTMIIQLPIAMILAVILSNRIRGNKFFKNVIFFPSLVSGVAVALLWQFIYHPQIGLLNGLLSLFTLRFENKVWISDPDFALWAVIIAVSWQFIGYHMILFIAGITRIPKDIVEAAKIDGVSGFNGFRFITFPLIRPIIKISLVLISTSGIKAFDSVFALTGGGPGNASNVLALHMYTSAFQQMRYGYGSAISTVLFLICILITVLISKVFMQDTYEF